MGLRHHLPPGRPKTLSFLSVCVSTVCFWITEFVCTMLPLSHWNVRMILILLDRGRFVVVHPCSTFSVCCQLVTPCNVKVQQMAKFGVFCHPQMTEFTDGDEIWHVGINYRSTLAYQILPSSMDGLGTGALQISEIAQNCSFSFLLGDTVNGFKWNLAYRHRPWSTFSCQIWLRLVKGIGTRAPKCDNLVKIVIFRQFLPHIGDTIHRSRRH